MHTDKPPTPLHHSEAIQKALQLLQDVELEQAYAEAVKEDSAFDVTASDGLPNEIW